MSQSQVFHLESTSSSKTGPWNEEESLKYVVFLDQNKIIMSSKLKKKKFRVFDQMSDFVKTRTPLQCRSHHQKAIQRYKEVKKIIQYQKEQLQGIDYKVKFKALKEEAKINLSYQNMQSTSNIEEKECIEFKQKDDKNVPNLPKQVQNGPILPNQMPVYYWPYNSQFYSFVSVRPEILIPNHYFYPNSSYY